MKVYQTPSTLSVAQNQCKNNGHQVQSANFHGNIFLCKLLNDASVFTVNITGCILKFFFYFSFFFTKLKERNKSV